MRFFFAVYVLIACLASAFPAIAEDSAGTVVRVQGKAVAVRDAEARTLEPGALVLVGDVLSTGKDSRLEIRMIDDGTFTLGEKSSFFVIDYSFGQAGGAAVELISGAVKAVSGKIARMDPAKFRMETPVATIGVRGTRFWAGYMHDHSFHVGLWSEGAVTIGNRAGQVEIATRGHGTTVAAKDASPTKPKPWPEKMNDEARRLVSFE